MGNYATTGVGKLAVVRPIWNIEPVRFSVCARGHEVIPKGKHHDRRNEHDEEDQETEGAEAFPDELIGQLLALQAHSGAPDPGPLAGTVRAGGLAMTPTRKF